MTTDQLGTIEPIIFYPELLVIFNLCSINLIQREFNFNGSIGGQNYIICQSANPIITFQSKLVEP